VNALRKLLPSIGTGFCRLGLLFVRAQSGYRTFDKYGQPICSGCRQSTNSHYANHRKLECWNCGREFEPVEPVPTVPPSHRPTV
jgi:hypothetical protein